MNYILSFVSSISNEKNLKKQYNSSKHLCQSLWYLDCVLVTDAEVSVISSVERAWPADWSSQGAAGLVKRNMVVADDAAFREKSKLLTSMERQKWLNSYMQKLLVVNSS